MDRDGQLWTKWTFMNVGVVQEVHKCPYMSIFVHNCPFIIVHYSNYYCCISFINLNNN